MMNEHDCGDLYDDDVIREYTLTRHNSDICFQVHWTTLCPSDPDALRWVMIRRDASLWSRSTARRAREGEGDIM